MASSSSTGEEPQLVTTEAKMVVATGRDHCQQLKDMLSKEDPSSMVVVVASSNQTSTPNPRSPPVVMDPGLLAVASSGSWKNLQSFLNGDPRPTSSSAIQQPSSDQEAQIREAFLDGLTVQGDTFLHVMATKSIGDSLDEAGLIHRKAVEFRSKQNKNEDTPLHCAARAGKSQMVSFLIELARGNNANNTVKELLEKQNNRRWTALHEAVQVGNNDIVKLLMEEDPELASVPNDATSPMYLAILLENETIARTLHEKSQGGVLSYSGPNGQNALHAAVLRGKDLTKMLLGWNKALTMEQDENGSTPLHLAASKQTVLSLLHLAASKQTVLSLLLEANPDVLYQSDKDGLFPIHVAASVGATNAIRDFLKKSPDCAGLRDARGRTFLHVAVDQIKMLTVIFACINPSLSWILNMQDNNGNTALHLAVKAGDLTIFCALFRNSQVQLSLTSDEGKTPLDIARCSVPMEGLYYHQNNEVKIHWNLKIAGAKSGICRHDYLETKEIEQARKDEVNRREMVKDSTQNLSIVSVLIATVTFGATFAMPGGYRADDQANGGTPTLAGRYAFDAFIVANTLAFTFSVIATVGLMASGSPMYSLPSRVLNLRQAFNAMISSVKCLVVAFALATYIILAPVAHAAAITVCVLSSLILLYAQLELANKVAMLYSARACRSLGRPYRKGLIFLVSVSVSMVAFIYPILLNLSPIVVIFGLSAFKYTGHKVEPAAHPPTPLA